MKAVQILDGEFTDRIAWRLSETETVFLLPNGTEQKLDCRFVYHFMPEPYVNESAVVNHYAKECQKWAKFYEREINRQDANPMFRYALEQALPSAAKQLKYIELLESLKLKAERNWLNYARRSDEITDELILLGLRRLLLETRHRDFMEAPIKRFDQGVQMQAF